MQKFLERSRIALAGIWAEQAAIVHDRARQHRRRDVDHRRGVARPGPERYVSDAIQSDFGADTFTVAAAAARRQTRKRKSGSAEQPARHARRADTRSAASARASALVMAQAGNGAPGRRIATNSSTASGSAASRRNTSSSPTTNSSAAGRSRRLNSTTARPVDRPRLGHRRSAVRRARPDRQSRSRSRASTSASSASTTKKGSIFGKSQDEFAVVPLGAFQKLFGSRRSRSSSRSCRATRSLVERPWTRRASRCASLRRLRPKEPDNFGMSPRDTILEHLQPVDRRHLRGAHRRRQPLARRRRRRHHEHHADGRERAHARDRAAQGARRAPARHPLADPDRVDHAVDRSAAWSARCSASSWRGSSASSVPCRRAVETWAVVLGIS